MSIAVMTPEAVQAVLKQRYPMLLVDRVISLEVGKSITTIKMVTGNEINSIANFASNGVLPSTLLVEAIGQSASILFAETTGGGRQSEFLVLGSIDEMKFLKPVAAGDRMEIDVKVAKFVGAFALVDAVVRVESTEVAKGRMGFARRVL
jgi:3-hydroxyacyl-[acyl-carrier-protein] dehydratase